MKQFKIPVIVATISAIIFYLEISLTFAIGNIISTFFPCTTPMTDTLPCYYIYDIYFMALLAGIILISIIIILIRLIKQAISNNTKN